MVDTTGLEVAELLSHLIRNACVNDGTPGSGHETRTAEMLEAVIAGPGVALERYEPTPGRTSVVARIEGFDRSAPTVVLLGHTDVVPARPDGWRHDPFGGDIVGGEVWGRGAIDMLNLTASMAVAVRRLADRGIRPRGTLVFAAVADEEAMGEHGAEWLTEHAWDCVGGDFVITESGGIPIPTDAGQALEVTVGEKGAMWARLRVKGTPGHASRPLRTDNALLTAAELVRRIGAHRDPAVISETWRQQVAGMNLDPELAATLVDPVRLDDALESLPDVALARRAHACTHMTLAPTVMHAGTKVNVIPDRVDLDVDIRALPGQRGEDVQQVLADLIGDLSDRVEIIGFADDEATVSPAATPLWRALERVSGRLSPGSRCVPTITTGASDARFYRRRGAIAYGFGLFSGRHSVDEIAAMFHGDNERVDIESLALTTELWVHLAQESLA